MENKPAFTKEYTSLDLDTFKRDYFKMLSPYFNDLFAGYFQKIQFKKINDHHCNFLYEVIIDEKCANPLMIVHGGALATLIENLATVSLNHFSQTRYKTLDISINYKNQAPLHKKLQIYVDCQKVGFNTSFVEVEVREDGSSNICTQASIIKSKISSKESKQNKNKSSENEAKEMSPKF